MLHSCVQPAAMVSQGVFNFRSFGSELDGVLVFVAPDVQMLVTQVGKYLFPFLRSEITV